MTTLTCTMLSKDEKRQQQEIMAAGNVVLHRHHAYAPKGTSRGEFRGKLFGLVGFTPKKVEVMGVIIPKKDVQVILSIREIEQEIIEAYLGVCYKEANRSQYGNTTLECEDYVSEALMTLLECIYGYTNTNIKFITYLTNSIRNKMKSLFYTDPRLSGLGEEGRKKYCQYQQCREQNPEWIDEEIAQYLGLTYKEAMLFQDVENNRSVVTGSSLCNSDDDDGIVDYTTFRQLCRSSMVFDHDQWEAVEAAMPSFSEWEMAVLWAFLESGGEQGWQTDVANAHINPVTGKPYSRQAPKVAMDSIRRKVLKVYQPEAA